MRNSMRFDTDDPGWPGHVTRREGLEQRLRPGMRASMWGAMAGNLAWEMLRIVGRRGRVWCQEPDPRRTEQARDFFVLPNLDWCDSPNIEWPTWDTCDLCVVDWVPQGGDHLVLEALRGWPPLPTVRSVMTEQRDPITEAWMREHGFQHAADSRRNHEWWDRR